MSINVPFTEQTNAASKAIDLASPDELIQILSSTDQDIFCKSYAGYAGLLSDGVILKLERLSSEISRRIRASNSKHSALSKIILSGCGTSGRLAFFISNKYNNLLETYGCSGNIAYLIAGGDKSLHLSFENPEDDPSSGKHDLINEIFKEVSDNLFIGVSCGLSAPYVAGQLEYCLMNKERFAAVVVGFNPAALARSSDLPGCEPGVSFQSIIQKMEPSMIVNPVVGPEALTGSSRMKGGTSTKIILDSVFMNAIAKYMYGKTMPWKSLLDGIKYGVHSFYKNYSLGLALISDACGDSLRRGGHVYYLGTDEAGLFGLIDASECVPTFGSSENDFRAYLGGWDYNPSRHGNENGSDACRLFPSIQDFQNSVLDGVTVADTIVLLGTTKKDDSVLGLQSLILSIYEKSCTVALCFFPVWAPDRGFAGIVDSSDGLTKILNTYDNRESKGESFHDYDQFRVLSQKRLVAELSIKLSLNAFSTGAHISIGKVFKNIMVDLKIANSKLYSRGVSIVSSISQTDWITSELCLLKSIYRADELSDEVKMKDTSLHIVRATKTDKVVPVAILLASGKFTIDGAVSKLEKCQHIRLCLESALHS